MPSSGLVVADRSPLLNLALIDRLDLLESQFSSITVPEQVREELADDSPPERLDSFIKYHQYL